MSSLSVVLLAAAHAAVGGRCLFRAGPIDCRRVALAVVATALAYLVSLPLTIADAASFFLALNVAYVDFMVVTPLFGVGTLLARRTRAVTAGVQRLAWLSLALVPIGTYATFVEPFRLTVEEVTVPVHGHRLGAELRVAVLSDVQSIEVHDHLRRAVARTIEFAPHLILLPGDLMQAGTYAELERATPAFRALLADLAAPLGVYFVLGNCDTRPTVERVFEGTDVRVLENEVVELEHAGATVLVGGCGFSSGSPDVRRFVRTFEARAEPGLRVLVSHYPDVLWQLEPATRVDLLVAGHTHGGQVQVPGFGPPITLSSVPRHVAAGGLFDVDGRRIYVSRGLGCERGSAPRVRFLAPPELSLLTLAPSGRLPAAAGPFR